MIRKQESFMKRCSKFLIWILWLIYSTTSATSSSYLKKVIWTNESKTSPQYGSAATKKTFDKWIRRFPSKKTSTSQTFKWPLISKEEKKLLNFMDFLRKLIFQRGLIISLVMPYETESIWIDSFDRTNKSLKIHLNMLYTSLQN